MIRWKIEYWSQGNRNSIEKWLDKRTPEQLKSLTKEIVMLEEAGNKLKLPHSKALGRGLFELRERRFCLRVYYGFLDNVVIILLAAGNKQSQEKDIAVARERLSELTKE